MILITYAKVLKRSSKNCFMKYLQIMPLGSQMAPPKGSQYYIVSYWEKIKRLHNLNLLVQSDKVPLGYYFGNKKRCSKNCFFCRQSKMCGLNFKLVFDAMSFAAIDPILSETVTYVWINWNWKQFLILLPLLYEQNDFLKLCLYNQIIKNGKIRQGE